MSAAPEEALRTLPYEMPYQNSQPSIIDHVLQPGLIGTSDSVEAVPEKRVGLPAYIKPLPASITEEDIDYLDRKGALTVPDIQFRNILLRNFVEFVYGPLPVVDLRELLDIIEQGDGQNGQISLLLFQAVMFAGAASVDMEYIKAAGYQTRRAARLALFQKVRVCTIMMLSSNDAEFVLAPL